MNLNKCTHIYTNSMSIYQFKVYNITTPEDRLSNINKLNTYRQVLATWGLNTFKRQHDNKKLSFADRKMITCSKLIE